MLTKVIHIPDNSAVAESVTNPSALSTEDRDLLEQQAQQLAAICDLLTKMNNHLRLITGVEKHEGAVF